MVSGLPLIILGAGGHSKVIADVLRLSGCEVMGAVDPDPAKWGGSVGGYPVLGPESEIERFSPDRVRLVNGVGSMKTMDLHRDLFLRHARLGYEFATIVHPSAIVASDVALGEGSHVMAGAVIQPGATIGRNVIVNTRSSIDHDCRIGDHSHIAPGVTLSGNVSVGQEVHVGTGAAVIQGIRIGDGSLIGAGACVVKDVRDRVLALGVPAREIREVRP